MIRLPQIALLVLLLVAAIPALVGLCASGVTVAAIGWESIAVWCVSGVFAAILWDRKLRQFSGPAPIVLAVLAIAAFAVGLFWTDLNFAATGAVLSLMLLSCCLARKSNTTSLAGFAAVALPASLAVAPAVSTLLNDLTIGWATTTAGDLLHLANIAHVARGDVVTTAIERFPVGYRIQGWATWPVMAALALLYSALMGRNWLHSLAMAATAVPLCVAYHAGAIAMVSASDVWMWQTLPTTAWPWISALATAIALLSVDRVFELIFKQIEADENASRANPLVHAWNQFVQRTKVSDSQPHPASTTFITVSSVVLLVLGCMAIPAALRSISELGTSRRWNAPLELTAIVKQGHLTSDHFAVDRIVKPHWGRVGDIWLATGADALTQLTVMQTPLAGASHRSDSVATFSLMGTQWTVAPEQSDESPSEASEGIASQPEPSPPDETNPPPKSASIEKTAAEKTDTEDSDTEQAQPAPERFVLPELPVGVQVQLLVAEDASLEDKRSALKDTGHAISFQCQLAADGSVVTNEQKTPSYWVRLMRRSSTKPNTRQAQELADQLDKILAAIQQSFTGAEGS